MGTERVAARASRLSSTRRAGTIATHCSNAHPDSFPLQFPLNAAQREAVAYDAAPLLVLAGAGSGKTRVITAKIAHLVTRGVAPEKIVAITFTNKAAREMRERARAALQRSGASDAVAKMAISTFHAYGLAIVRAEARTLGLAPGFSIFDPADAEPIVAE